MLEAQPTFNVRIRAEAAAWLSRIRAESVTEDTIASFQIWLNEDARHRCAFTAVTETWELVGSLPLVAYVPDRMPSPPSRLVTTRRSLLLAGLAAAIIAAWDIGVQPQVHGTTYRTEIGEQRRVALLDGSTVVLDTDSSIRVDFSKHLRSLHLLYGRAFFEVAHDPTRPFVVQSGTRQVVAIGTEFDVTQAADGETEILLVEGHITVALNASRPGAQRIDMNEAGAFLKITAGGAVLRDRRALGEATAWQEGRIVFNNESLERAIARMNRYTRRPLRLGDPAIGQLRISGVYRTGDVEAFAESLSALLSVTARFKSTYVTLEAPPAPDKAR